VTGMMDCSANCPWTGPRESALDFPVGQIRRVAAVEPEVDETKRNLLKLAAVAGVLGVGVGGVVGGTLQYVQPPTIGLSSYPAVQLLDVDGSPLTVDKVEAEYNYSTGDLYLFDYPLRNEPNFFLNLYTGSPTSPLPPGVTSILNAIGPPGSPPPLPPTIVAFSAICQHLGCPAPAISYYPPGTCPAKSFGPLNFYIHCSCHGSTYDVTNGAANLTGPAIYPLPQVYLVADPTTGIISATSMYPGQPVKGHLNTLQGDYGVGNTSELAKESPVILCSFPSS
jgi:Rieske Fe-S protein